MVERPEPGMQPHVGMTPEQKNAAVEKIKTSLRDSARWESPDESLSILRQDIARLILGGVITPEELFTPDFHAAAEKELRGILDFDIALGVHGTPRGFFKELCAQWRVPRDQVKRIVIEAAGKILHEDPELVSEKARTYVREFLTAYGIDESEVPKPS